jgi:hypothetical protein
MNKKPLFFAKNIILNHVQYISDCMRELVNIPLGMISLQVIFKKIFLYTGRIEGNHAVICFG